MFAIARKDHDEAVVVLMNVESRYQDWMRIKTALKDSYKMREIHKFIDYDSAQAYIIKNLLNSEKTKLYNMYPMLIPITARGRRRLIDIIDQLIAV